ncbi:alpha/beta fold hydrolase [Thermopolyspora sp. NPDC052614]|uniref:alpha/beta fold hydrolase n=1 Tax=Thermopolyspora sp. NPDC052614 TaxID=3155682 RepID=UPI0034450E6A
MSVFANGQVAIGYDDHGTGEPPVVLVHGTPFDRSMWRPQIDHLRRYGRRVIALDLRGYGESTVVPGITRLDAFARDIAALLDHLAVDGCVLGGLSMGGQIVMEFCRLFPGRVRGLLLADTTHRADTDEGRRARDAMAERLLREGMKPYAHEVLPKMISPATVERLPAVADHVLTMMCATAPEGAAAALRGRGLRPDYTETLARIRVPTLIVVGADDEYTPVADARLMHDLIPGSTLTIIENAAHMPNLERPAEFNQALDGLLRAVSPRPGND